MKHIKYLFLVAILAITLSSCNKVVGEGPTVTQDRNVSTFTGIDVSVPAEVYYTANTTTKLQIEGQQNIIDLIETNVLGGTLQVRFNRNNVNIRSNGLRIYVLAPDISNLHLSGSANLFITKAFKPINFDLGMSGSCNANIDSLNTNTFHSAISGSGSVYVANGIVEKADMEISGSGNIDLVGLAAKEAITHSSGSGKMKLQVSDKLEVHISGSGEVYYKGAPNVTSEISGSGKVSKLP